jgi:uncharacterized membrane protein YgcG
MTKWLSILTIVVAMLWSSNVLALNISELRKDSRVYDPSLVLTTEAHDRIDFQLQSSQEPTSVWIVPELHGQSIEDLALDIGAWHQSDNILIILAMAEHRSRIETNPAIAHELPNQTCADILRSIIGYYMSMGDDGTQEGISRRVEGALSNTIDSINIAIDFNRYQEDQLRMLQVVMFPAIFRSPFDWISQWY